MGLTIGQYVFGCIIFTFAFATFVVCFGESARDSIQKHKIRKQKGKAAAERIRKSHNCTDQNYFGL